MGKNRDGAATDFQIKKLEAIGFKGKKPTTYREAENLIKRLTRAVASAKKHAADPVKVKPVKAKKTEPTSKPKKNGSDVDIKAVPLPSGVRGVGLVFAVPKKKAGKK